MYDPSDTFYKFRHLDVNKDKIYRDVFTVDVYELYGHDPEFAMWLLENHTWFEDNKSQFTYSDIKIVNLVATTPIRELKSGSIRSLVQVEGVVVLALFVAIALAGAAILYAFHRFRKSVLVDEHDRMKH